MCSEPNLLVDLINGLEFTPVDDTTAMGDFHGLPAAFSVLGFDPPAFTFQIRLNPDDEATSLPEDVPPLLSDTDVSMSIENGCAWLSVYDAEMFESEELSSLLDRLAQSVIASGQARPDICLRCSRTGTAELMYVERRPTRLCTDCLDQAAEEKAQQEAELNQLSAKAALSLPVFAAAGAGIWAAFWFIVELALDYWSIDVIEVHSFSMMLILGLLGGVGWGVGWPVGMVLRRTAIGQRAPLLTGIFLTASMMIVGEILLLALILYWNLGIIDLGLAAQFAWFMLQDYSGFWLLCKLTLACTTGLCCCLSAAERKTVALKI